MKVVLRRTKKNTLLGLLCVNNTSFQNISQNILEFIASYVCKLCWDVKAKW
jgi:hypothetical protein